MCCWESHTIHLRADRSTSRYLLSQQRRRRKLAACTRPRRLSYLPVRHLWRNAIYALRVATPNVSARRRNCRPAATAWRRGMPSIAAFGSATESVAQFWLNPYNGALLATIPTGVASDPPRRLWRSGDGGAHWRYLQAPQYGITTVLVQPPQANHPWGICVADFTASPGRGYAATCCIAATTVARAGTICPRSTLATQRG